MESPQITSSSYWYEQPGNVDRLFYGVFEGGGAKGIAYVGALRAMRKRKCWFRGVAGASAGAITAALVAAGMSPEQIETETDNALKNIRTGWWAGVKRLKKETGYFSSDELRDWLNGLLTEQVCLPIGGTPNGDVSFKNLYEATGIELNIVAADLSMRCHIVFSHYDTPNCSVADAVAASSSIPFAFPSRLLQVSQSTEVGKSLYHHTIVDGGVWSNFPMYIFEDEAFRAEYEREPERIESRDILGFVLQESNREVAPSGKDVRFVSGIPVGISPREWNQPPLTEPMQTSVFATIGTVLLYPFYQLGRFVDWNSGIERGRWPTPRSRPAHYLVTSVNGLLGGIHPPLIGMIAFVLVLIGAWTVTSWMVADQLAVIPQTDWTEPKSYFARIFGAFMVLLITAVSILVSFGTLLVVIANHLLLRTSRRILYGLVMTYVAGSGAPEWVAKKSNVVCLPIPPAVKTLSFDLADELRKDLIDGAEHATLKQLDKV